MVSMSGNTLLDLSAFAACMVTLLWDSPSNRSTRAYRRRRRASTGLSAPKAKRASATSWVAALFSGHRSRCFHRDGERGAVLTAGLDQPQRRPPGHQRVGRRRHRLEADERLASGRVELGVAVAVVEGDGDAAATAGEDELGRTIELA